MTDALGQPMSKRTISSGEVWQWEFVEATTKKGSVFLIFASESTTEDRSTVYVEFDENGTVRRTWRE